MSRRKPAPRRSSRRPPPRQPDRPGRIIVAAFEEFSAHGFAATRLDDVARRAGVAKGTIFLHFKNKQTLFRAVVRSLARPVFGDFVAFAETFPGSAEQLVGKLLSRICDEAVKSEKAGGILRMVIAECGNFPQLAEIWRREMIGPALTAFHHVLRRGLASGEFRTTRVEEFPQILVGPAMLAILWMLLLGKREPLDLDGYFEAYLEFVLRGLKAAPASRLATASRSRRS